jgi:SAM-dependent methyltransferase
MTDRPGDPLPTGAFYDALASEYDSLTGFEQRFEREETTFRTIVGQYGIRTALDAGCGTGFHSLLLARLGVRVTATDISGSMLERAASHALEMNLQVHIVKANLLELPAKVQPPFDAVFCLGNTLPHLRTGEELFSAISNFGILLSPGGVLVIQMLNYHRLLTQQERIISVKERDGITTIRFYDFLDDGIIFNVLTLSRSEGGIRHTLRSTMLRPIHEAEIATLLSRAGFGRIRTYGSIKGDALSGDSTDLVIHALKAE